MPGSTLLSVVKVEQVQGVHCSLCKILVFTGLLRHSFNQLPEIVYRRNETCQMSFQGGSSSHADAVILVVDVTPEHWQAHTSAAAAAASYSQNGSSSGMVGFHDFKECLVLFMRTLLSLSHSRPIAVLGFNGVVSECIVPRPPGYNLNGSLEDTNKEGQRDEATERASGAGSYPSGNEVATAMYTGLEALHGRSTYGLFFFFSLIYCQTAF